MSKAQEFKSDLLPCPMCGGTEILVKKRKTTMVECKACGLVVFDCQDGVGRDAIAHWNTRASSSSEQQPAQQDAELSPAAVEAALSAWFDSSGYDFDARMRRAYDAARASNGGKAND